MPRIATTGATLGVEVVDEGVQRRSESYVVLGSEEST